MSYFFRALIFEPKTAICIFCLVLSNELLVAWHISPFDQFGWLAFLVWISPALFVVYRHHFSSIKEFFQEHSFATCEPLAWWGLAAAVIGTAGDLNVLKYLGLSLAVASWIPWSADVIIWMVLGICWMPFFGWIAGSLPISMVILLRTLFALLATAMCVCAIMSVKQIKI